MLELPLILKQDDIFLQLVPICMYVITFFLILPKSLKNKKECKFCFYMPRIYCQILI